MTSRIFANSLIVVLITLLVLISVLVCEDQRKEAEEHFSSGIRKIDSSFPDYCQARIHFENAVAIVKRWSFFPANLIVKRKPDYPFYVAVAAAISSNRVSEQPCSVSGFSSTFYAKHDLVSIAIKSHTEAGEWSHQWYAETGQDVIPVLYTELCQWRKRLFEEFVEVLRIRAENNCVPNPGKPPGTGENPTATKVAMTGAPTVDVPVVETRQLPAPATTRAPTPRPQTSAGSVPTPSIFQTPKSTLLPAPSIGVVRGEISFSQCRRTVIRWGWIRPLVDNERFSLRVERNHPTPQFETRAGGDYPEPENGELREFRITDVGIQGSFWVFGYISVDGDPISYESNRILIVCGGE